MEEKFAYTDACRLCGRKKPGKYSFNKEKIADLILKVVGIRVADDDHRLPKIVCHGCYAKLRRQKKIINKQMGGSLTPWNIPEFPQPLDLTVYKSVCHIRPIAEKYGFFSCVGKGEGTFVKLHAEAGEVFLRVEISGDLTYKVLYKGKGIPFTSRVFEGVGTKITTYEKAQTLFQRVALMHECPGNEDFPFIVNNMEREELLSQDQQTIVGYKHRDILHAIDCNQTSAEGRCAPCTEFRSALHSRKQHLRKKQELNI